MTVDDNHLELAVERLNQARDKSHRTVDVSIEALASIATGHAVLALLDYLQQDDEPEPAAYRKDRENLIHIIEVRDAQIQNLKKSLQDSHAALRARDNALDYIMKERNADAE